MYYSRRLGSYPYDMFFNPSLDVQYSGTKGTAWNMALDANGNWIVYIWTTGTLTIANDVNVDVFCVGGGGGGMGYWGSDSDYQYPGGGGGGGRCATVKQVPLVKGVYTCSIGAGGVGGYILTGQTQKSSTSGGTTSIVKDGITFASSSGGTRSAGHAGGAGGSGGGGGGNNRGGNTDSNGGTGGSNGTKGGTSRYAGATGDGQTVKVYGLDDVQTVKSTMAFGVTALTNDPYDGGGYYYAPGGGGGNCHANGGSAAYGKSYYFNDRNALTFKCDIYHKAAPNIGSGGGGISNDYAGGNGSSGLIILRNAR